MMKCRRTILFLYTLVFCFAFGRALSQKKPPVVFGYFAGRASMVDSFPIEKLTHLCYSFTHLKGNRISVSNARDTATLRACIALKKRKPSLKVIVSMGGWTGCYTCSGVFASDSSRKIFASSVKQLLNDFQADGLDLDWEYPAIPGPPNHPWMAADKENFTSLIKSLRDTLGNDKELSFAAGGFTKFINESVDWDRVTPLVNRINLMTYDLITGYDTVTGHHTGLYSTKQQKESCNNAVKRLVAKGVPANKLLIGAAFYARVWENVEPDNNGLYGKGKFLRGISYRSFNTLLSADSGFVYHWDQKAAAPYLYNARKKWFVTFDDPVSIRKKTLYARKKGLNGIMFWQLGDDAFSDGLLGEIEKAGW